VSLSQPYRLSVQNEAPSTMIAARSSQVIQGARDRRGAERFVGAGISSEAKLLVIDVCRSLIEQYQETGYWLQLTGSK
jgi:hypothetical protein